MCSRYEPASQDQIKIAFGVEFDAPYRGDLNPGYEGPFVRAAQASDEEEPSPSVEVLLGKFGLLPFWSKTSKLPKSTFNARSETVAEKPSFRNAWKRAQHCIIPAAAIYEPDWRSGSHIPTRITRADGEPMGIAGIWERWIDKDKNEVLSFSMLTINADDHVLMKNYHRPGDEKRMVVILPAGSYQDWLHSTPEHSREFLRQYPADRLAAEGRP
ncbi:SOS response-associated peptidase [Pseudomonas aeruginosa]